VTQHQLAIIYGTEMGSEETRRTFQIQTMYRPIQRCIGIYSFDGESVPAVEIEEICVANSTMSKNDYLEGRRLYLTVGMFYNDRIFGEIHALLRLLHLPTWKWIEMIHEDVKTHPDSGEIRKLYEGFVNETMGELWETPQQLVKDVTANMEKYAAGEIGGNLIYKYRSAGIIHHFIELQQAAYRNLRAYLTNMGMNVDDVLGELEKFSRLQKTDILATDFDETHKFHYDIVRMIADPSLARDNKTLQDIHYENSVRFTHTDAQKEMIKRQLIFYGADVGGMTMLMSRFPIKRFYRSAQRLTDGALPASAAVA
jgi:hypothetical protein